MRGRLLADEDDRVRVFAEVTKRQDEPHDPLRATNLRGRHNPRCPILPPLHSLEVWHQNL